MTYKLIWISKYGKEEIEENIKTLEEAKYLKNEYNIAFNEGKILIKNE